MNVWKIFDKIKMVSIVIKSGVELTTELWGKCQDMKQRRVEFWANILSILGNRRGRDRMVVGFITTYAISAYHHWCCEF
jgi:hypothetical protein